MSNTIHINVLERNNTNNSRAESNDTMIIKANLLEKIQPNQDTKINSLIGYPTNYLKLIYIKVSQMFLKLRSHNKTQFEVFQSSMKYCLVAGQCFGLFPIVNVTEKDIDKIRYKNRSCNPLICKLPFVAMVVISFKIFNLLIFPKSYNIFSWRYLVCLIVFLGQTLAATLSFYKIINSTVNITNVAYFSFYASNCISCILFVQLATKWNNLIKLVASSQLNEYIDQYVIIKCNFAAIIIIGLTMFDHMLSIITKFAEVQGCGLDATDTYKQFILNSFPWLFELNVQYSIAIGIYLPVILNFFAAIIWSYTHLFIICVSLYLSSILEQINIKIVSREGQFVPVSFWRVLREDYNKATRLVHAFDDVINSIVFVSFGSNLFFVCLQFYNVLGNGIKATYEIPVDPSCYHNSRRIFNGYEHEIYFTFSLMFVLLRSLAVSLIAAKVHTASLEAAPSLYSVPSSAYCSEVQRFIEQIHGDTVGFTGLNFFFVTKELVLSVVGTIVTYELVLLQFNGEDVKPKN